MPRYARGEPIIEPPKNLTIFGGWFYYYCNVFGISLKEIARRINVDHSTLSRNTRFAEPGETPFPNPRRDTVTSVVELFAQLAKEQGMPWTQQDEEAVYNAAGFATAMEIEQSRKILADRQMKERQ
jgi:hypothetical protein